MSKNTKELAVDVLLIGGAILVAAGAGVLSLAAGLITGGVLSIAAGAFLGRGLND